MNTTLPKPSIWGVFAIALFLVPLIGFPLHAIVQPNRLPPMRFVLHAHAVSAGLWFILVITQSFLISKRNYKLHKTLGWWSVGLAIVVLVSGLIVTAQFYERRGMWGFTLGSYISFGMFALFYICGLLGRKNGGFHKRMMLFATIALMPAATNRFAFVFGLDPSLSGPIWIATASLIPIYDLITTRRVSRASMIAIAVWIGMSMAVGSVSRGGGLSPDRPAASTQEG